MSDKPEIRFEIICEWFEKAARECKRQGKRDSAMLWADGLDHLIHLQSENDALRHQLAVYREALEYASKSLLLVHKGGQYDLAEVIKQINKDLTGADK